MKILEYALAEINLSEMSYFASLTAKKVLLAMMDANANNNVIKQWIIMKHIVFVQKEQVIYGDWTYA